VVLAAIVLPTFAGAVFDTNLEPHEAVRANGLFGFVSLYLQLLVTAVSLGAFDLLPARFDPRRPTLGRYPAAFGLSFLYLVTVGPGLLLLVVPD
jgi:hypothetical protein